MPTGYTAKVATGEMTEFSDFALLCARAFGATIDVRDEPLDNSLPERFEPSPHYKDCMARDQAEIERLISLSQSEIQAERDEEERKRTAERERYLSGKAEQKARYEAMLEKVSAWEPPTSEHVEMKRFMVEQLTKSIDFDCQPSDYRADAVPPADEWLKTRIERLEENVKSWASFYAQEVARTEGRNQWVSDLRNSLQLKRQ